MEKKKPVKKNVEEPKKVVEEKVEAKKEEKMNGWALWDVLVFGKPGEKEDNK